ncbi:hypothetical protein CRUP_034716 [Coryphaenoides rupestris]|nr:hypothetical protein CRUP_034716 [Coryphaenoides rupestris]
MVYSHAVETELINTAHTNVLLLRQLFSQADKFYLRLQTDISELENRRSPGLQEENGMLKTRLRSLESQSGDLLWARGLHTGSQRLHSRTGRGGKGGGEVEEGRWRRGGRGGGGGGGRGGGGGGWGRGEEVEEKGGEEKVGDGGEKEEEEVREVVEGREPRSVVFATLPQLHHSSQDDAQGLVLVEAARLQQRAQDDGVAGRHDRQRQHKAHGHLQGQDQHLGPGLGPRQQFTGANRAGPAERTAARRPGRPPSCYSILRSLAQVVARVRSHDGHVAVHAGADGHHGLAEAGAGVARRQPCGRIPPPRRAGDGPGKRAGRPRPGSGRYTFRMVFRRLPEDRVEQDHQQVSRGAQHHDEREQRGLVALLEVPHPGLLADAHVRVVVRTLLCSGFEQQEAAQRMLGCFHKHKALRVILAVVVVFVLSQLPYNMHLMLQATQVVNSSITDCAVVIRATAWPYMHACFNPFLYVFVGERFRRDLLCVLKSCVGCLGARDRGKMSSGAKRSKPSLLHDYNNNNNSSSSSSSFPHPCRPRRAGAGGRPRGAPPRPRRAPSGAPGSRRGAGAGARAPPGRRPRAAGRAAAAAPARAGGRRGRAARAPAAHGGRARAAPRARRACAAAPAADTAKARIYSRAHVAAAHADTERGQQGHAQHQEREVLQGHAHARDQRVPRRHGQPEGGQEGQDEHREHPGRVEDVGHRRHPQHLRRVQPEQEAVREGLGPRVRRPQEAERARAPGGRRVFAITNGSSVGRTAPGRLFLARYGGHLLQDGAPHDHVCIQVRILSTTSTQMRQSSTKETGSSVKWSSLSSRSTCT